jgi:glycosyltransferase involved in cell wall biosynthesis
LGLVLDNQTFYAACDVFAVPSYFDPCPLVTFEAAARGLPVIATDGVGNLPNLLEYDCGAAWEFGTPMAPLVCELMARRERCREGAKRMAKALSRESWCQNLKRVYDEVLERNAV